MDCPMCGGAGEDMGTLGRNTYIRCRYCGFDYVDESEAESYNEEPEFDNESEEYLEW